jgi:hypothetical protein
MFQKPLAIMHQPGVWRRFGGNDNIFCVRITTIFFTFMCNPFMTTNPAKLKFALSTSHVIATSVFFDTRMTTTTRTSCVINDHVNETTFRQFFPFTHHFTRKWSMGSDPTFPAEANTALALCNAAKTNHFNTDREAAARVDAPFEATRRRNAQGSGS